MKVGVSILAFFGMAWGLGAAWSFNAPGSAFAVPPIISFLVLAIAWSGLPRGPVDAELRSRTRRVVRFWSMVEGAAMIATVLVLQRFGLKSYIPSAFSVVIGLHFLPLARGIPQPVYYLTAAAMVIAGAISAFLTPALLQAEVASSAAAFILWSSAIGVVILERRSSASAFPDSEIVH